MKTAAMFLMVAGLSAQQTYQARIDAIGKTPGLVAFWDFVLRDGERFAARLGKGEKADLRLDAVNYVREYWAEGRAATMADFPMRGEGPFGDAVEFRAEADPNFRPLLLVPRVRLHGSGIDVKGPGQSVTLLAWIQRQSGNHAIAGIWHEGTDLAANSKQASRVEQGMRQYALFAGLAANNGASAAHVSENGGSSFGDKYARNLSVTSEKIPAGWCMVGLRFDNKANTVTSSIDGRETEYWIENPDQHAFFQWAAKGYREGSYTPPESRPLRREKTADGEILTFAYSKVKVTRVPGQASTRQLIALKANPFWFPHDLFVPAGADRGGPFTIGRVIHSSRSVGFTGAIGGVAVLNRALSSKQLQRIAKVGRGADGTYELLRLKDIAASGSR
jgi:hypothetical protein